MTTLKSKRPQYKLERVVKDDGATVQVARVALKDLDTLLELQDRLLEKYIKCEGSVGKLFTDDDVIADLRTVCSLLPIVGAKEETYLNYDDIAENWEQLIVLFLNGGLNEETRTVEKLLPSRISQLHFLPYLEMLQAHLDRRREELEKEKGNS